MDYLTRRSAAASGHRGALLRASHPQFPRLSALGVRVERGAVVQAEIVQALRDLRISVELPPGVYIPASKLEEALAAYAPEQLRRDIDAFLDKLAAHGKLRAAGFSVGNAEDFLGTAGAARRLCDLPEPERSEFAAWLNEWRCTAPVLPDVPPWEQDGYYEWDYSVWKSGKRTWI